MCSGIRVYFKITKNEIGALQPLSGRALSVGNDITLKFVRMTNEKKQRNAHDP